MVDKVYEWISPLPFMWSIYAQEIHTDASHQWCLGLEVNLRILLLFLH